MRVSALADTLGALISKKNAPMRNRLLQRVQRTRYDDLGSDSMARTPIRCLPAGALYSAHFSRIPMVKMAAAEFVIFAPAAWYGFQE